MKIILVFVAIFLAVTSAAPRELRYGEAVVKTIGGYGYEFETSNQIKVKEEGKLENFGLLDEGISVKGEYQFLGQDGNTYRVTYVADNNGFRPKTYIIPK